VHVCVLYARMHVCVLYARMHVCVLYARMRVCVVCTHACVRVVCTHACVCVVCTHPEVCCGVHLLTSQRQSTAVMSCEQEPESTNLKRATPTKPHRGSRQARF
jgi:hypothetical protein